MVRVPASAAARARSRLAATSGGPSSTPGRMWQWRSIKAPKPIHRGAEGRRSQGSAQPAESRIMRWIRCAVLLAAFLGTVPGTADAHTRPLPDTWNDIHVGLVFDYRVPDF